MDLSLLDYALLIAAGAFASALNAVAGGGTFFTFPILMFVGLPPVLANTTNKVGIWIGSLASIGGFWREVKAQQQRLRGLLIMGTLGGLAGALLLLYTPPDLFEASIPWLLGGATFLFAYGRRLVQWFAARRGDAASRSGRWLALCGQWLIGVYGGFFGAGLGILMMALCELMQVKNINDANGLKVVVATAINAISVVTFVVAGAIHWPVAAALAAGAVLGGFGGATLSRRIPDRWLRRFIIAYGCGMTAWFMV